MNFHLVPALIFARNNTRIAGTMLPNYADQRGGICCEEKGMVPLVGFELTTYRLQGGCSTN
jgi:hypothetical protein